MDKWLHVDSEGEARGGETATFARANRAVAKVLPRLTL